MGDLREKKICGRNKTQETEGEKERAASVQTY
jgi:hypothetical protein